MKRILLIITVFACSNAFADFNGDWLSTDGRATGVDNASCSAIQFHIAQTDKTLTLDTMAYAFGGLGVGRSTMIFDIAGSDLLINNQKLGEISSDNLTYSYVGSAGGYDNMTFNLASDGLTFTQDFSTNGLTDHVTANLKKQ